MGTSSQNLSYNDVKAVLNAALDSELGVKVPCGTRGRAYQLRHRMNAARSRDRIANAKIYPDPDHPMHNSSPWDALSFRIAEYDDPTILIVQKLGEGTHTIVPLTSADLARLMPQDPPTNGGDPQ